MTPNTVMSLLPISSRQDQYFTAYIIIYDAGVSRKQY